MHLRDPFSHMSKQQEMAAVAVQEPMTYNNMYKNMEELLEKLSYNISNVLLDRFIMRMELDNKIDMETLFEEIRIRPDEEVQEFNLFYSSYQGKLFRMVENRLFSKGYYCNLTFEKAARSWKRDKLNYTTKIIKPISLKKIAIGSLMTVMSVYMALFTYYGNKMLRDNEHSL